MQIFELGLLISMPWKRKYLRANSSPFMNKAFSKAVMDRARLRNKFLKNISAENKMTYNRQGNYCVSLTRKSKRHYYNNFDNKNVTDNKLFLNTVNPFSLIRVLWDRKSHLLKLKRSLAAINPTSKYLSPGRPKDVPLQRPQEVL